MIFRLHGSYSAVEGDHEEAVAKVVKELKATRSHSVHAAEWTIVDGVLYF